MSKDGKSGRGRKEHQLKVLLRENTEAKKAFAKLVDSLGKMQLIASSLISDGLKIGKDSIVIESISIPTLALIIKENGHSMKNGRPIASGSTVWKNKPQAIQAVCSVLRDHGLHKGRDYLLNNGISYTNEIGEVEHFTFSENGKSLLSITTLSKVARENEIKFMVGPRKVRTKSLVTSEEQEEVVKKKVVEAANETEVAEEDEIEDKVINKIEDDEDEIDDEDDEDEDDEDEDEIEDEEDEDEDDEDDEDEDDEDEIVVEDDEDEDFDDDIEDLDEEDDED
jgi:hypothetical protein